MPPMRLVFLEVLLVAWKPFEAIFSSYMAFAGLLPEGNIRGIPKFADF